MRLARFAGGNSAMNKFRERLGTLSISAHAPLLDAFRELTPRFAASMDEDAPHKLGIGIDGRLSSCLCNQEQLESPAFQRTLEAMRQEAGRMHRKHWEWAFVARALEERGMLVPGRRGMGFAVGQEPLTSFFCSRGCRILATDVAASQALQAGWVATGQHAASLSALNCFGIATSETMERLASFREVDMRALPSDLPRVDFLWSACAMEHLGDLRKGMDFVLRSFDLLEPGGVAVHTTEFNLDSDWTTIGSGADSIYRRCDLEQLGAAIEAKGGSVRFDFREGKLPADLHVDRPPYRQEVHLRLEMFGYRCTSFGLIFEKPVR